jgi:hypothetical protein
MSSNVKNFIEQHPESVAQVFSMYGIKSPVNEKSLASAIVVHKSEFLKDLTNLIAQNSFDGIEGSEAMDGIEGTDSINGVDVIESYGGRRHKAKRKHRHRVLAQMPEAKILVPSPLLDDNIRLIEQSASNMPTGYQAQISRQEFQSLPVLSFPEMEGEEMESVRGKKKEFTYGKDLPNYDAGDKRRKANDTIGIISKGLDAAGNVISKGVGIAGQIKGLKDAKGNPIPDSAGDGAPAPEKGFDFKKYAPYIIGGVAVVIVLGVAVYFLTKKKK